MKGSSEDQRAVDGYIRYMAQVNGESIARLFGAIDGMVAEGVERLHLLLNTPGGGVAEGIAVHNYLKGAPIEVITHNFGTCDSIGVVMFCAGKERLSVPHARFLLHPVQTQFPEKTVLLDPQLEERLKSLRLDQENIARVVADTTGKQLDEVLDDIRKSTTLNPQQARAYKLVTEIRSQLHPAQVRLVVVS